LWQHTTFWQHITFVTVYHICDILPHLWNPTTFVISYHICDILPHLWQHATFVSECRTCIRMPHLYQNATFVTAYHICDSLPHLWQHATFTCGKKYIAAEAIFSNHPFLPRYENDFVVQKYRFEILLWHKMRFWSCKVSRAFMRSTFQCKLGNCHFCGEGHFRPTIKSRDVKVIRDAFRRRGVVDYVIVILTAQDDRT
jgi:hypothetical protein